VIRYAYPLLFKIEENIYIIQKHDIDFPDGRVYSSNNGVAYLVILLHVIGFIDSIAEGLIKEYFKLRKSNRYASSARTIY
jgi:hypothetical protein